MDIIDKIKNFIDRKILKKDQQKLLMAPSYNEESEENYINLSAIQNHIKGDKYNKNLYVSFGKIKPSTKKAILKGIETRIIWCFEGYD